MVNSRTLGMLLDTLQRGDHSLLAARPAAPVARAAAAAGVARDIPQSPLPVGQLGDRAVLPDVLARRTPETGSEAAPVQRSATAVGPHDATPLIRSVHPQTPSASLELSAAGQWLQRSLLTDPMREPVVNVRASAPLVIAMPDDARALGHALRESIAQSGLFYESHLAAWTVQQYAESELRREPQAGWASATGVYDELPLGRGREDDSALAVHPRAGDESIPGMQSSERTSGQSNGQLGGQISIDLLRAQLQALESRQFSWQGDLWPGQAASITIGDDGAAPGSELTNGWRTHLTLILPELGKVDVDLRLDGPTVQLALAAADPHSVELLSDAGADLVLALEAHAHVVGTLGVRQS